MTLPPGWTEATLSDLVVCPGDITDGPFGSNLKTAHYTDAGPRVIRLQNIGDGVFKDERAHISPNHFETLRKHEVIAGDILVASLGEELPRACIAPEIGPAIVKADCIRIRPHADVSSAYIAFALNSPAVREATDIRIRGVGRPRINLSDLRATAIPVPPAAEQVRVVDEIERRLSRLDAGVRSLEAAGRRLAAARPAILAAAVLGRLLPQRPGDEPVELLLKRAGAARATALAAQGKKQDPVTADPSGLPPLPAEWEWASLDALADIVGGVTKDSKRQSNPAFIEVPYLRVANVQRGWLNLSEITTIRVPPAKAEALRLWPGDVLFNEGGDRDKLGRGWVWDGQIANCIHQNHVFRARLYSDRINPKFLSWFGNSVARDWFEAAGKQTTNLASLNLTTLKSLPVPVPPWEEQDRIVAEVERRLSLLDATERSVETNLRRASALRRAILKDAFAGRLVTQDPTEEPADELLARIQAARPYGPKVRRPRSAALVINEETP